MSVKLGDISTAFRYRAPNGDLLGVHEAARRAGEMLSARGSIVEGALLTAEYHAAIANRDGIGEVTEQLEKAMKTKDKTGIGAEVAALAVVSYNAAAIAAKLQVYMQAFAGEFKPVHPDSL